MFSITSTIIKKNVILKAIESDKKYKRCQNKNLAPKQKKPRRDVRNEKKCVMNYKKK